MATRRENAKNRKSKRISFGGSATKEFSPADFEALQSEHATGISSLDDVEWPEEESNERFTRAFRASLGLEPCDELLQKVVDPLTLEGIAKHIKSGKCNKIVTMVGPGVSASAGIPDFRCTDTDLNKALQTFNLPRSTSMFEIGYFWKNPKPFFYLAKELWPTKFLPTPSHYFIKLLADKGLLLRHYTQNFDSLEGETGIDPAKLIEAAGTFRTGHCVVCEKKYHKFQFQEKILADEIPICTETDCDGIIKPDVLLYMEKLPHDIADTVIDDLKQCDLLIVMGTSLETKLFATLTGRVSERTPRLYIHTQKTGHSRDSMDVWMFGGGFLFDSDDNIRDVFWRGSCDDGCYALAELLGWGSDLKKMIDTGKRNFDLRKNTKLLSKSTPVKLHLNEKSEDNDKPHSRKDDNSFSGLSVCGTAISGSPRSARPNTRGTAVSKNK